jgi:TIR domain
VNLRELAHAVKHKKRLVPVVHRDVDAEDVPQPLNSYNRIFYRESDDFDDAIQSLLEALNTDLEWVRVHTRLLTRAIEWDKAGRDNSFVLRGIDLREAEEWQARAADKDPKLTSLQNEYILASRAAVTRRQRIIRVAVTLQLTVTIVLVSLAIVSRNQFDVQISAGLSSVYSALIGAALGSISGYVIGRTTRRAPETFEFQELPPDEADPLAPATVFVSYGRKDWKKFVRPRVIQLRKAGLKVWLDQQKLHGGEQWLDEIDTALNTCERMVLFVSPNSVESKWVKKEYRTFLDKEKILIPVLCRETRIPFELQDIQRLPFEDPQQLISRLKQPQPQSV